MIYNGFYYKFKIACLTYGQNGSGKTFKMMGTLKMEIKMTQVLEVKINILFY